MINTCSVSWWPLPSWSSVSSSSDESTYLNHWIMAIQNLSNHKKAKILSFFSYHIWVIKGLIFWKLYPFTLYKIKNTDIIYFWIPVLMAGVVFTSIIMSCTACTTSTPIYTHKHTHTHTHTQTHTHTHTHTYTHTIIKLKSKFQTFLKPCGSFWSNFDIQKLQLKFIKKPPATFKIWIKKTKKDQFKFEMFYICVILKKSNQHFIQMLCGWKLALFSCNFFL